MNIYFLPAKCMRLKDARAAIELLRGAYNVVRFNMAPFGIGLIYQTETPVATSDLNTLNMVPWE